MVHHSDEERNQASLCTAWHQFARSVSSGDPKLFWYTWLWLLQLSIHLPFVEFCTHQWWFQFGHFCLIHSKQKELGWALEVQFAWWWFVHVKKPHPIWHLVRLALKQATPGWTVCGYFYYLHRKVFAPQYIWMIVHSDQQAFQWWLHLQHVSDQPKVQV